MTEDLITVVNHDTNKIDLTHHGFEVVEFKPTELHFKADGDIEGNPSFCIVGISNSLPAVYMQFSLKTIQKALAKLGYTLYQP